MKPFKLYSLLLVITLLASCSSDNNNDENPTNATSKICNNVTGPTAVYWDYSNGLATPLTQAPLLKNTNGQFIHSQLPYIGFPMPQGYTATEVNIPQTQTLGVNVIRNDNAVVWRYVPTSTFPANFSANDIIATEINSMFNFYGFNANFEVLCSETKSVNQTGNVITTFNGRLIRFGNFTGLVWIIVTQIEGLASFFVTSSVSSGPTNEYNNLVMDIFLPLSFQLYVNDRGTLSDRDGDGVPDIYDREPDNPNIQ